MVSKKTDGFRCETKGKVLNLYIYGEIAPWEISAKDIIAAIEGAKGATAINVYINSPGGFIFEAFAIYNVLHRAEASVAVYIDGVAASSASIIAMAGGEIIMAANAYMMIHNPSGFVMGDADDLQYVVDLLKRFKATLVATYAARTDNTSAQLAEWMDEETWFDAEEAVEHGFADSVAEEKDIKNEFDWSQFNNTPSALMPQAKTKPQPQRAYSRQSVETIVAGFPDIFGELSSDAARESEGGAKPLNKEGDMPNKELTFTEAEVKAKLEEAKTRFDLDGKVAHAKAVTEAVNTAVAEAQITAKADQEKAIAEAENKAAEGASNAIRDGIKEVLARCETAGISLSDARGMIDKDLSLEDAKDAVIAALVKQRDAVGGEPIEPGTKKEDPKAKHLAEFKAAGGFQGVGVTEEQYVDSRLRTEAGGTFE